MTTIKDASAHEFQRESTPRCEIVAYDDTTYCHVQTRWVYYGESDQTQL